ncbi:hypothetical protein HPB48_004610 [Haemaphysalis longicornis]|uniref:Myb/SANT-like DNA-binding domain-containing protein n=1 Tax=Haemaphysalis longicornis TaxID=44386 RepID=A0A9J6GCW6_HAELO|nr:hypothetical protein HPB48_004610 [Haemaphysalis longicornis]
MSPCAITKHLFFSDETGPWEEGETRLLLMLYARYSSKVGPMKKFRSKRVMYEHISKEILQSTGIYRTQTQCESRFKTIAKRKKNQDTNNRTSGQTRCQVSYEEEFAQIRAADDSIEPEVLRGVHSVTYKTAPKPTDEASTSTSTTAPSDTTVAPNLWMIPEVRLLRMQAINNEKEGTKMKLAATTLAE